MLYNDRHKINLKVLVQYITVVFDRHKTLEKY